MNNIDLNDAASVDVVLSALGEQLGLAGASYDLVVVGGSALLALGLVTRVTRDVDLVAAIVDQALVPVEPIPPDLERSRDRVTRDFGLPAEWLNTGPSDLMRLGLPGGFQERLIARRFGPHLIVRFASRLDQIHLKLYAAVDHGGPGKHERDLLALQATPAELLAAARWSRTHDPSEGYLESLLLALRHFGVPDADLGT